MFSHLTLPRFLVPSSLLFSRSGCGAADTEEHVLVGIGWQSSSGLPADLSKYAQSSTCLASYYYLEFLPVSYV